MPATTATTGKAPPDVSRDTLIRPAQVHPDLWERYCEALYHEDLAGARAASPVRAEHDLKTVRDVRERLRTLAGYGRSDKARDKARSKEIDKARKAAEENRDELQRLQARQRQLDNALAVAEGRKSEEASLIRNLQFLIFNQHRHIGALLRAEFSAVGLKVCPQHGYVLDANRKPASLR